MGAFSDIDDPTDLDAIRAAIASAERPDALVPLGLHRLVIEDDAAARAAIEMNALLDARTGKKPTIAVLTDATAILSGTGLLKPRVIDGLSHQFEVSEIVLGTPGHLHVDDDSISVATQAAQRADGIVSVGSGTVSDIAKIASARAGGIPHVLIQTAASVDGYTDNVSVVLRAGAKRTIDSRWPDVVLADTAVIRTAPRELNAAGFGELQSLFTAPADWWLASQIGTDTSFHATPRDLLQEFAGDPRVWGEGLGSGNPDAVQQLTRVLAIRGIGTGIAGTTACLSGVEHLVSHMLDMYAVATGHDVGLHGAQVGVASVIAASAWEHLLTQMRDGREILAGDDNLRQRVLEAFETCDPSGALGAECWKDYSAKRQAWASAGSTALDLLADANSLEHALGNMLPASRVLAEALAVAEAPLRVQDLGDWVTPEVWRWAVSNCLYMRNRVTVVDLLAEAGWWTSEDVTAVIARAESAVASARAVAGA